LGKKKEESFFSSRVGRKASTETTEINASSVLAKLKREVDEMMEHK